MMTLRSLFRITACAVALLAAVPALAQPAPVHVVQSGDTLFRIARQYGLSVAELKAMNGIGDDNIISVGQQLVVRDGGTVPVSDPEIVEETAEVVEAIDDPYADEPADVGVSEAPPERVAIPPPAPIPAGPPPPPPPPATITRVAIGGANAGRVVGGGPPPSEAPSQLHVVQRGETLFTIARQYGITVADVRALNGLSGDLISVGQQLRVGGGAARPVAPAPRRGGPYNVERSTVPDDLVHVVRPGDTLFSIAVRYGVSVGQLLTLNALTTAPLPPGTVVTLPESAAAYYREPAPLPAPEDTGLALVYPDSYQGRETISGEPYDPADLTASHRTFAFGTILLVTLPATGRSTLVRVNDRGPVSEGFLIELSAAAADALGQDRGAAEEVELRVVR